MSLRRKSEKSAERERLAAESAERWTPPPPADEVAATAAEVVDRHAAQDAPDDGARARALKDGDRAVGEVVDGEAVPARQPKKPEVIPHPVTGEAVAIVKETATNVLAELRSAIVDHERSVIRRWKSIIDAEIRDRLDLENVRSATVGPSRGTRWKVSVPAPTKTEWDGEAAYKAVRELVRRGLISATAAGRCVERVVEYNPKHAELTKLSKHADERVVAAVAACRTVVSVDDRRVSVSPIRTGRSERDD